MRMPQNSVFRNTLVLLFGASAAKAIGIISMPVLARLYDPSDFGALSIYIAFVITASAVANFRYSVAVPLPKTQFSAFNVLAVSFVLTIISVSLLSAIFIASMVFEWSWGKYDVLKPYWMMISFGVLFMGVYEAASYWLIREGDFRRISKSQFYEQLSGSSFKIIAGFLGFSHGGLIAGQLLQHITGAIYLVVGSWRKFVPLFKRINLKSMLISASTYRDMPVYRMPAHLLMVLSMQSPILMSAAIYDIGITGQISMALMALAIPISFISVTASKAYYGEISRIGRNNPLEIRKLTRSFAGKLLLISVLPSIMIFFMGEWVFTLVFGPEWSEAGRYAEMLAIYLPAQFIAGPLASAFNVFGRQKMVLALNAFRFILVVSVFLLASEMSLLPATAMFLYSFSSLLYYLVFSKLVFFSIR